MNATPIYAALVAEIGIVKRVETEYEVLAAQAVMDLLAERAP